MKSEKPIVAKIKPAKAEVFKRMVADKKTIHERIRQGVPLETALADTGYKLNSAV